MTSAIPDVYVDFKGWRFTPPFRCMCCGREIDVQQFCFGRACGICDTGKCHNDNKFTMRYYSGPRTLIDPDDSHFLSPDRWLNPETGLVGEGENPLPPPMPNPFELMP